jgi:serine/threonine protein kinase
MRVYMTHTYIYRAFGVTAFIFLTGKLPFVATSENDMQAKILRASYVIDEGVSAGAQDFINKLLVVDRKARMTAAQALQHDWVSCCVVLCCVVLCCVSV